MSRVSITERSQRVDGAFQVVVGFEGGGEFAATVTDPLADDPGQEGLLAWYFERHLRYPFLDKDREAAAVARITEYGAALFAQAFADPDCGYEYRRLRDGGFDGCRIEVVGSMALHSMHWEALRDPAMSMPLAVRVPLVRRVETTPTGFDPAADHPTLNILVVTARPGGPADVGYRTISRPLLDAVRQARLPVVVDLVRPGTWQALAAHLEATTRVRGSGWYQVVHFDLHGAVAGASAMAAAGYLFADHEATEGADAYLFFETAEDGKSLPVPTAKVADLLVEHRVPVAVLNACQSAKPPGQSEASLAQRLVEAGVPVSLGMAYSVTVSAAVLMMPALYQHLAEGADLLTAAHAARRRLFADRSRRAYFDQSLDLEDWMLPVVYRQRPVEVRLRPFSAAEEAAFYAKKAAVVDEPRPTYGFVGRDLDVQAIERRLLAENNELLLSGMTGAGKSTLLAHLAWWWQVTGLVGRVLWFSYEDRAWTVDQRLAAIAKELLDTVGQAAFSALADDAQLERAADLLRSERHLLVLDNAESITATPAAIPHSLPEPAQARLRRFLSRLRGGKTLVLIGSRGQEEWLAEDSFAANVHELYGLDPQASSVLVERVLSRHRAAPRLEDDEQREALEELVGLLGGYPLPLTLVLPALTTAPPTEVLQALREGTEAADETGLIRRAIEFSYRRMDPATQNALLAFAPFTAVVPLALDRYAELLAEHEGLVAVGPLDLAAALHEAVRVGLATVDPTIPTHLRVQPLLPYFLRNRLRSEPGVDVALAQTHHDLYADLGPELYRLLTSRNAMERTLGQDLTRAEYANLTTALAHAVATGAGVMALLNPVEEYLRQTTEQHARGESLDSLIKALGDAPGQDHRDEIAQLHRLAGISAQENHRLGDARQHHEASLDLFTQLADRLGQGTARHNLGVVAQEQRHFEEAEDHYRRALQLKLEFGEREGLAATYHQLGNVAQLQGRFEDAEGHYREVLKIKLELRDRHGAAPTYHQLGVVALKQGRFEEAEDQFRTALDLFLEFHDRPGAARAYHQLGMVARLQNRFEEAEDHYRKALEIKLNLADRHGAAKTYCELGMNAQLQNRFEEAEVHYRKALDVFRELEDRYSAAISASELGILLTRAEKPLEAVPFSLDALAAIGAFGQLSKVDLRWLERQSRLLGDAQFDAIVDAHAVPLTSGQLRDLLSDVEELSDGDA